MLNVQRYNNLIVPNQINIYAKAEYISGTSGVFM